MKKEKLTIVGMTCAACQSAVEKAISQSRGVSDVNVNLLSNSAVVVFDEDQTSIENIRTSVKRAGYDALPYETRAVSFAKEEERYAGMKKRLVITAVFALIMLYLTFGNMSLVYLPDFINPKISSVSAIVFALIEFLISLTVIFINKYYFKDGFHALISGSPNMNTLVSSGAGASFIYGIYVTVRMFCEYFHGKDIGNYANKLFFESVTMIITLISLGRVLEARSRKQTSEAVRKLISLTPPEAEVRRKGIISVIPTSEISVGDCVIVRAGGSIPCDGNILSGNGSADESMITGESMPVEKNVNDSAICGTILLSGYIEIEAIRVAEDTTVSQITEMVENASSSKAPQQKLADKISRIFVPVVFLISVITFVLWLFIGKNFDRAVTFAISVLVISCPCSLGLATPTAVMCGIGRGASMGILIKSAESLNTLSKSTVAVFDKTGTITAGKLNVADIVPLNGSQKEVLLAVAASLESLSEHPVGKAIYTFSANASIRISEPENFDQTFGGGVSASVEGHLCSGGNRDYILSNGTVITDEENKLIDTYSKSGKTPIIFSSDGILIGIITVSDKIKDSTSEALSSLISMGITPVMLTGDNGNTASAIAEKAGISTVISDVKPDEKALFVRKIMSGEYYGDGIRRYVMMVGDGINDAPALSQSDCGISIKEGSDIAIESAEVILVKNDLKDIPRAVMLSKKVVKIIKENLGWAFFYNILCIPVAAGVLFPAFGIALTPVIASAAMSFSSICVVTNALRLLKYKPEI